MKHFTIKELCRSNTAAKLGIDNTPDATATRNLVLLVDNILDPLREKFGKPIYVNRGYSCPEVNKAVGGADNSQHQYGEAADITAKNQADNAELFRIIKDELPFDQLIWEKGNDKYPAWVHVSFVKSARRQVLRIK